MNQSDFIVIALAVWRLSYLVTHEDGPDNIVKKLRKADDSGLLACIYCTSIWIAVIVVALWYVPGGRLVVRMLAASGGAMMMHRYTGE